MQVCQKYVFTISSVSRRDDTTSDFYDQHFNFKSVGSFVLLRKIKIKICVETVRHIEKRTVGSKSKYFTVFLIRRPVSVRFIFYFTDSGPRQQSRRSAVVACRFSVSAHVLLTTEFGY